MATQPADPVTALAAGALATHEMYRSYVEAGFTEEQALQITIALLINAAHSQQ